MNLANSRTAKEMSGRVHVGKYIHFPTMAQNGSLVAAWRSSSVVGHISFVRQKERAWSLHGVAVVHVEVLENAGHVLFLIDH
jgi:hypothetical protein